MTGKLEDKVAIITGAGQGVGRGIALAMAKAGARCVIVDFNEESGQQVVGELEGLGFDTGFRGSFRFMQAAYPHLKASRGKVINIASGAGLDGLAGQSAYGAAKEAIRALSKSAAREWGRDGINVNIICPLANSPGVATLLELAPEMEKRMTANQPLGRIGDCEEDIGPVAVFLASDDSRYVTGHTLPADGGNSMVR